MQGFGQLGGFKALGISNDPTNFGGYVNNAVAAAVIGGTAAVLGGGKFANGALTGAFSRLFNDLAFTGKKGIFRNTETGEIVDLRNQIQQTPDGYLAEQAGASSVGDYTTTTNKELAIALSVGSIATGVGGIATSSAILGRTAFGLAAGAFAADRSLGNATSLFGSAAAKLITPKFGHTAGEFAEVVNTAVSTEILLHDAIEGK